ANPASSLLSHREYRALDSFPTRRSSDLDAETPAGSLLVSIVDQHGHGALTRVNGGVFSYAPAAGYSGADSFSFTVTDAGGPAGTARNSMSRDTAVDGLTIAESAPASGGD